MPCNYLVCVKCNQRIKPVSLATVIAGENYHPMCICCSICNKQIWGRAFKKEPNGSYTCETPCKPQD